MAQFRHTKNGMSVGTMSGFILGRYREYMKSRQSTKLVRKQNSLPKKLHMSKYHYTKMFREWKIPFSNVQYHYGQARVPFFQWTK